MESVDLPELRCNKIMSNITCSLENGGNRLIVSIIRFIVTAEASSQISRYVRSFYVLSGPPVSLLQSNSLKMKDLIRVFRKIDYYKSPLFMKSIK